MIQWVNRWGSYLGQVGWGDGNDLELSQAIAVSVQELAFSNSHTWLRIAEAGGWEDAWGRQPFKFFWNF